MALVINYGDELVRFNPSNKHIEYSNNEGVSWYWRYTLDMGNARCLVDCGKGLLLCSEKGIFFSDCSGRSWNRRNSIYTNFTDMMKTGSEIVAFTNDGHVYYSKDYGCSWNKRK